MLSTLPPPSAAPIEPPVRWDVTLACDRACEACPFGAVRWRDPREMSTIEAMLWMNRARAAGRRRLELAGGDPTRRGDLEDLVRHAIRLGMEVVVVLAGGVVPAAGRLRRLREAGLRRVRVRRCGARLDRARVAAAARAAGLEVALGDGFDGSAARYGTTGAPRPAGAARGRTNPSRGDRGASDGTGFERGGAGESV